MCVKMPPHVVLQFFYHSICNFLQLLHCKEEQLPEFTNTDSSLNISDILVSSGFPHICITKENRQMAYECCLIFEVIGKRLSALDDFRKGLGSIHVFSKSCLELLEKFPELSMRFDCKLYIFGCNW